MRELLRLLASSGGFLYRKHDFRIVDSGFAASYGDKEQGFLTLTNGKLEIRLSIDHAQVPVADIRAAGDPSAEWHSLAILRQLLSDQLPSGEVDRFALLWMRQHFAEVEAAFGATKRPATETACRELEDRRAERFLGRPPSNPS